MMEKKKLTFLTSISMLVLPQPTRQEDVIFDVHSMAKSNKEDILLDVQSMAKYQ
jgi:hypothetical protein